MKINAKDYVIYLKREFDSEIIIRNYSKIYDFDCKISSQRSGVAGKMTVVVAAYPANLASFLAKKKNVFFLDLSNSNTANIFFFCFSATLQGKKMT